MCVIIYKPKGIEMPTAEDFRRAFGNNPHGAGFMWASKGAVHIRKGYMSLDTFSQGLTAELSGIDATNTPIIFHFRITTQGGIQTALTHPFPVTGDYGQMRSLSTDCKFAMAHNGIIPVCSDGAKDHNDTMRFVKDFVNGTIKSARDAKVQERYLKANIAGSRLAFMDKTGEVTLIGKWYEQDGLYWSNPYSLRVEKAPMHKLLCMSIETDHSISEYYDTFGKAYEAGFLTDFSEDELITYGDPYGTYWEIEVWTSKGPEKRYFEAY